MPNNEESKLLREYAMERYEKVRDEILTKQRFEQYLSKNGVDMAQGYADAIKDFLQILETAIFLSDNKVAYIENTPMITKKILRSFHDEIILFLPASGMIINSLIEKNSL